MKNKLLLVLVFFIAHFAIGQKRQPLFGKIINGSLPVKDVLIVNISSQREVKTNEKGEFNLLAEPKDTLVVALARSKTIIVTEADFSSGLIIKFDTYELEEVVVTKYNKINAVDLGIVPADQKQYTVAEKRLSVAYGDAPEVFMNSTTGTLWLNVVVPTDGIINKISGRTRSMERALESENKEKRMETLYDLYDEQTIVSFFKVPKEYAKGFLSYVVEDADFARAAKENNETLMQFLISGLAVKYLELIKDEK
ncbi:hypothetical protein ACX0HA_08355 [Flavobacterium hauense]